MLISFHFLILECSWDIRVFLLFLYIVKLGFFFMVLRIFTRLKCFSFPPLEVVTTATNFFFLRLSSSKLWVSSPDSTSLSSLSERFWVSQIVRKKSCRNSRPCKTSSIRPKLRTERRYVFRSGRENTFFCTTRKSLNSNQI